MTHVRRIMLTLFDVIGNGLSKGDDVTLREFGKFEQRDRNAVVRKHPQSGKDIPVPAKKVVVFLPSDHLKQQINNGHD